MGNELTRVETIERLNMLQQHLDEFPYLRFAMVIPRASQWVIGYYHSNEYHAPDYINGVRLIRLFDEDQIHPATGGDSKML